MAIHYICDGCSKRIFPVTGRFHCLVCTDYDSCQTCHMTGRFSPPHEASHPFHILYVPSTAAATSLPGTMPSIPNSIPPPPPPPPPVPQTKTSISPPQLPLRSRQQAPPLPPRSFSSQSPPILPPPDQYWGFFITPQRAASPMLSRLSDATFTHFAPNTQSLTPERLSAFYSAMNRTDAENFPQLFQSLMVQYSTTLDPADEQIAFVFREYGYDYITATRAAVDGYEPVINGMPLITREGFRKMLLDEILEAPDNAYTGLNALLQNISILVDPVTGRVFEYKEVPRVCFPKDPDPVARAKGDRISAALMERSRAMFDALAKAAEKRRTRQGPSGVAKAREEEAELQAEADARERLAAVKARIAMEQYGQDNILGGWRVDSMGNRYYDEGLI